LITNTNHYHIKHINIHGIRERVDNNRNRSTFKHIFWLST